MSHANKICICRANTHCILFVAARALPVAFTGRDVIGLAETGSGKTGAFALPILQVMTREPPISLS